MKSSSIKRIAGIDILKIVSMLFIILQHLLFQGQIVQKYGVGTVGWFLTQFLYGTSFFAVNCYALASWFLCYKQKYKISRIIYIWIETLFYSLVIYAILAISNLHDFSVKDCLGYMIPIITGKYWYITAYFFMFLFIPLLNTAINSVTRATFKTALLFIFIFMSCGSFFYTVIFFKDPFALNRGYSAMWLIVMYLFGAYIGKYEVYKSVKAKTMVLSFAIFLCLSEAIRIILIVMGLPRFADAFMPYVSPVNFVLALLLFVICLQIDIKSLKISKLLYVLSSSTLGIFLIHTHPLVREIFMPKLVVLTEFNPLVTILLVLICVILIFCICSLIDYLRIKLFNLIKINIAIDK